MPEVGTELITSQASGITQSFTDKYNKLWLCSGRGLLICHDPKTATSQTFTMPTDSLFAEMKFRDTGANGLFILMRNGEVWRYNHQTRMVQNINRQKDFSNYTSEPHFFDIDIDANGIVNVSAKDLGTGKEQHITISSSSNMSKEDIDKAVKAAEQFAEEDKKRREEVETKNNAENLCYQAEKLVNESGDKLEEADKTEVNNKVAALANQVFCSVRALSTFGNLVLPNDLAVAHAKLLCSSLDAVDMRSSVAFCLIANRDNANLQVAGSCIGSSGSVSGRICCCAGCSAGCSSAAAGGHAEQHSCGQHNTQQFFHV